MRLAFILFTFVCLAPTVRAEDTEERSTDPGGPERVYEHLENLEPLHIPMNDGSVIHAPLHGPLYIDKNQNLTHTPSAHPPKAYQPARTVEGARTQVDALLSKLDALRAQMKKQNPYLWGELEKKCLNPNYDIKLGPKARAKAMAFYRTQRSSELEAAKSVNIRPVKSIVRYVLESLSDAPSDDSALSGVSERSFFAAVMTAYGEARGIDCSTREAPVAKAFATWLTANPGAEFLEPCRRKNMSFVMEILRNRAKTETEYERALNESKGLAAPAKSSTMYDMAVMRDMAFSMWNEHSSNPPDTLACVILGPLPDAQGKPRNPLSESLSAQRAVMAFRDLNDPNHRGLPPDVQFYTRDTTYRRAAARADPNNRWLQKMQPLPTSRVTMGEPPPLGKNAVLYINPSPNSSVGEHTFLRTRKGAK